MFKGSLFVLTGILAEASMVSCSGRVPTPEDSGNGMVNEGMFYNPGTSQREGEDIRSIPALRTSCFGSALKREPNPGVESGIPDPHLYYYPQQANHTLANPSFPGGAGNPWGVPDGPRAAPFPSFSFVPGRCPLPCAICYSSLYCPGCNQRISSFMSFLHHSRFSEPLAGSMSSAHAAQMNSQPTSPHDYK
jgi:hypothetical protein